MKKTVILSVLSLFILSNLSFAQEYNKITMSKQELLDAGEINVYYPNFDFDADIQVLSYEVFTHIGGFDAIATVKGTTKFTSQVISLIDRTPRKGRIYFENIKVRLADGTIRKLQPIIVKIK